MRDRILDRLRCLRRMRENLVQTRKAWYASDMVDRRECREILDATLYASYHAPECIKMRSVKIITAYDDSYAGVGNLSRKSIKLYSAALDYEYEILSIPSIGRPHAWAKIQLIKDQLIKTEHEYVMWVDADAFFVRGDIAIDGQFEENKDLYLTSCNAELRVSTPWPNIKVVGRRINTGVMVFRKSQWSLDLLNEIWEQHQFINHHWWEQAALMYLIGDIAELSGNHESNFSNKQILDRVKFIGTEWNCMVHKTDVDHVFDTYNPVIVHLAGTSMDERFEKASNLKFEVRLG